MQCSAIHYITIQYSAIQYCTFKDFAWAKTPASHHLDIIAMWSYFSWPCSLNRGLKKLASSTFITTHIILLKYPQSYSQIWLLYSSDIMNKLSSNLWYLWHIFKSVIIIYILSGTCKPRLYIRSSRFLIVILQHIIFI